MKKRRCYSQEFEQEAIQFTSKERETVFLTVQCFVSLPRSQFAYTRSMERQKLMHSSAKTMHELVWVNRKYNLLVVVRPYTKAARKDSRGQVTEKASLSCMQDVPSDEGHLEWLLGAERLPCEYRKKLGGRAMNFNN